MKQLKIAALLALAIAMTASATTLTFTAQTENVESGGQFSAFITWSDPLTVYCVDVNNSLASPESVNVVNLADLSAVTADTRYGDTPVANFVFQTSPVANGTPQDRYAMAAWLIMQYNFSSGVTLHDDQIQNAIWTLLSVGSVNLPGGDSAGTGNYLTLAQNWFAGESASALSAFEGNVFIYSPASIATAGKDDREFAGGQEMIGFANVPEPNAAWLAFCGLCCVACGRMRHWRQDR